MIPWSVRRRAMYVSALWFVVLLAVGIPAALYLYEPPSCTDGKRNQGEEGTDCGGPCALLCPSDSLPFIVQWTQKFKVTDSLWSVAARIENPNQTSGAANVPYLFQLFDEGGVLLAQRRGFISVRPRESLTIFEGGFYIERDPAQVSFSFTGDPVFMKMDTAAPDVAVSNRVLSGEEFRPRLEALVRNNALVTLQDVPVTAVVFDKRGNAIGASRTIVETLEPNESTPVVFTWPQPFPVEIGYCESPADVAILLDRSSSMDDDGTVPPQPLTDVKSAAEAFLDLFSPGDQASVISFATAASSPPDQSLTINRDEAKNAVTRIVIGDGGVQQTNIGEGLERARDELFSERHNPDSKRVVVLLTDGIANYPKQEGDPAYAERYALSVADDLKTRGVIIYTIGLGSEVNEYFLRQVASGYASYYSAATPDTLTNIYRAIATSICRKTGTSGIDINVHLFPGEHY